MKKMIAIILITALTTACQTATQAVGMSQKGTAAFSCTEIHAAFAAYDVDRESASALSVLVPLISPGAETMAGNVATTSNAYYERAKASANIALMVQGCPIIP